MASASRDRVTGLLTQYTDRATSSAGGGDAGSEGAEAGELLPLVYDELRRLARGYLRRERAGHSLDATALVHEAYLRLVDQSRVAWRGRRHFLAVGAQMMRRLLVDHARRRGSVKRGGEWERVSLGGADVFEHPLDPAALLDLDRALAALAALDPRAAQVVELRFFGGLEVAEIAELLGISKRSAEGDWAHARAWLRRALAGGGSG
jgi:RNA polymerase sigma-70 factor (ECF subfamily)